MKKQSKERDMPFLEDLLKGAARADPELRFGPQCCIEFDASVLGGLGADGDEAERRRTGDRVLQIRFIHPAAACKLVLSGVRYANARFDTDCIDRNEASSLHSHLAIRAANSKNV